MSTCAVVVASGRSERFGGSRPKLLVPWRGSPLIAWTLAALDAAATVDDVVLVASEELERGWVEAGRPGKKVRLVVRGGATRQESVGAGVASVPTGTEVVLVHDGARPFASPGLIDSVALLAARCGAALPLLAVVDTLKRVDAAGAVLDTVPRGALARAQTPQGFRLDVLCIAQEHARASGREATDDAALVEWARADGVLPAGQIVASVEGERANRKVTRPEDLPSMSGETRVGLGHDLHRLEAGRRFHLAGIDLHEGRPETERFGPVGHSDGDALTHAVCDALLGAAALGDIGRLFPDTAAENANRASLEFLREVVRLLWQQEWRPSNVSAALSLERPRVAPFADRIRGELAATLGLPVDRVGLSAKRGEGLGPVGEGRAVSCEAVAQIERWA